MDAFAAAIDNLRGALAPAAPDPVAHLPTPGPETDDDDDEDEDDDRGSGGGNIDPEEDEGWSDDDDEEEEPLQTAGRRSSALPVGFCE